VVKSAIVTGSNRGLGEEVARELAARGFRVIGTARSGEHALDISDPASVEAFAKTIESVDVLVNNAAIAMDGFDANVAKRTIDVNVRGTMRLTEALLPKLRSDIVNVSSGMGQISILSRSLRERVMDASSREDVIALADEFVSSVANGTHERKGWPSSAYSVSKALINAYTRVLARELEPRGIRVNAVCPGWVRTRMGGRSAPRSIEEGAGGIVWAAENRNGATGGFFRDGHAVPW